MNTLVPLILSVERGSETLVYMCLPKAWKGQVFSIVDKPHLMWWPWSACQPVPSRLPQNCEEGSCFHLCLRVWGGEGLPCFIQWTIVSEFMVSSFLSHKLDYGKEKINTFTLYYRNLIELDRLLRDGYILVGSKPSLAIVKEMKL